MTPHSFRPRPPTALTLALALALSFTPAIACAQTLASRVRAAGPAFVRFTFAAQPDLCGQGDDIIRQRDGDPERLDFVRSRGDLRGVRRTGDEAWLGRCTFGPLAVTLEARGDRFVSARVRVGEREASGAAELGHVPAQEAVDFLLRDVIPRSNSEAARDALLAAVLADSAEAWPALLDIARDDGLPESVRRNAIFWVGQAAADKATEGLSSIASDATEDMEVRRNALFALSRQPRDVGIPALIDVARTSREPELVKNALFWLGQSRDPRAIDLFREILTRR